MAPVVSLVHHPWKAAKSSKYPPSVCQLAHVGAEQRVPNMCEGCTKCGEKDGRFMAWVCYSRDKTGMIMVKCEECGATYVGDEHLCPDPETQLAIAKAWEAADEFDKNLKDAKARSNALKTTLDAQKKSANEARRKANNAAIRAKKAAEKAEEAREEAERKAAEVGRQFVDKPPAPAVAAVGDREEIDRLRAREHRRLQGMGASAVSKASRGECAPVNVHAKLLFWIQPGQPPEECAVTVNTKATVFLEDLPVVAAHRAIEARDFWLWDTVLHKWVLATDDEIDVDKEDSTIFARVDYPGACQGFGTELHVLQDLMNPETRKDVQLLCDARRLEIANRRKDVHKVWIVLWWEFGTSPTAVSLDLHNGRWATLSDVQALMSLIGDSPQLDVWVHDQTQWSEHSAWQAITVPPKYDTVLVRKKGLSHMPYLGLEIAALETRRRVELPTYVPLPQNDTAAGGRGHAARTFKDESTGDSLVKTEARETPSKTIKHRTTGVNVVKTEARETPSKTKKARKPRDSAEYIDVDELPDAPVKVERVTRSKCGGALGASHNEVKAEPRSEGAQEPRVEEEAEITTSSKSRARVSGAVGETQYEPKAVADSRKRGRDEFAGGGDMSSVLRNGNAKRIKREPSLEGEDMSGMLARASAPRELDWARATVVDANGLECIDIDQLFE